MRPSFFVTVSCPLNLSLPSPPSLPSVITVNRDRLATGSNACHVTLARTRLNLYQEAALVAPRGRTRTNMSRPLSATLAMLGCLALTREITVLCAAQANIHQVGKPFAKNAFRATTQHHKEAVVVSHALPLP